jgi:hypothetical protein
LATPQEDNQVSWTGMEVKDSPCLVPSLINVDATFRIFEQHTKGIGLKLMKQMGYDGGCLGENSQGIVNPIKLVELTRHAGLGYVREEVGECSNTVNERNSKSAEESESSSDESDSMQSERKSYHSDDHDYESSPNEYECRKGGNEVISPHQTGTRNNQARYKNVPFDYTQVGNVKQMLRS